MSKHEEKISSTDHDDTQPITNYRGIKAMPFIIGNETFEKLGAIGTLANLLVYLTTVFNMKNITAATMLSIFDGTSNLAPLLGAFLSDTFFGRYKTLGFASVASFLGMIVLALTAAINKLHPQRCLEKMGKNCEGPSAWQLAFLFSSFGFLVVGAGGIRPCNLAFGVDQFDPKTESGQRGINSFFNWYYFTFTFAVMVSVTGIVYIQANMSWAIGLGIPACLMLMSCVLFFWGSKMYVKVKPEGSPLTSVAQVLVAAIRKRRLELTWGNDNTPKLFNYMHPDSINSKLPYTSQFGFLDKSAIEMPEDKINPNGTPTNPWRLCTAQQVEEVKCVVRVIPIWASAIIYHAALLQQRTYCILQAMQADRSLGSRFKVPPGSYTVITMLTLTLWIPIYDRIVVPALRRITGKEGGLTLLQRMGIGIVLSILTTIVSALVEERRRETALTKPTLGLSPKGYPISSMSALWLIPQLMLTGLSEGFNSIGQIEFYYKQFPENMRSIGGSFFFLAAALSSFLSGFLISTVHHITKGSKSGDWLAEDLNEAKLDYYYYFIGGLGALNFIYFLVCAKWYRYKGNAESKLELSSMESDKSEKHFV
ncbi:hypothetical protein ACFE04_006779 [Oxalis oulophora]